MCACATDRGLCLLEFVDRPVLEDEISDIQHQLKSTVVAGENTHTRQAMRELAEYFEGRRQVFEVALDEAGTAFQLAVWRALRAIPYGETVSYQVQAGVVGQTAAVRAVAAANGQNRIAIIVPCHRVIGKDGTLTGYGGGLPRKRWLIAHEQRHAGGMVQGELF
ncbi:MAG: methylated-DNA--[protein]-cysteine S-methyltransferase [Burkholderiales bacterium]|nr:methylated-DNA--[protein]-cysteine S-methyltransferase [Burkholderiales bacterium]